MKNTKIPMIINFKKRQKHQNEKDKNTHELKLMKILLLMAFVSFHHAWNMKNTKYPSARALEILI
jgi:uncharacterized membrane protein